MRLAHGVGDRVLAETAGRLSECTRGADTVCRMGGEEFVVILENLHAAEEAGTVAGRVRSVIRESYRK